MTNALKNFGASTRPAIILKGYRPSASGEQHLVFQAEMKGWSITAAMKALPYGVESFEVAERDVVTINGIKNVRAGVYRSSGLRSIDGNPIAILAKELRG